MDSSRKQQYSNLPMLEESSFLSSDSITSGKPLMCDSPSPESPTEDPFQENPYEMPLEFEESRRKHEERILSQRQPHRKKKSPLYDQTRVNGVMTRTLTPDEASDFRSDQIKGKKCRYNIVFVIAIFLSLLAVATSGVSLYVTFTSRSESHSTNTQGPVAKGTILFYLKL